MRINLSKCMVVVGEGFVKGRRSKWIQWLPFFGRKYLFQLTRPPAGLCLITLEMQVLRDVGNCIRPLRLFFQREPLTWRLILIE